MVVRTVLVGLFGALCVLASAPVSSEVKEPSTEVGFEEVLPGDLVLVGVGHRTKFGFNVYAAAAYVHRSGLERMVASKRPLAELTTGTAERRVIMHFVRNAPGAKIQETFTETLGAILSDQEKETCAAELKRLHDSIGVDAPKGTRVTVSYKGGTVEISAAGTSIFKTSNSTMTRALFEVYFGGKTILPTLVKDIKARIKALKAPAVQ